VHFPVRARAGYPAVVRHERVAPRPRRVRPGAKSARDNRAQTIRANHQWSASWFPVEAQEIRCFTERPRSEFFALRHGFLREVLAQRWYAYEQTVVMLLQAVFNQKRISRFFVGNISDLPEGREPFASAMQQVERTERVLKALWRERHQGDPRWADKYRDLEGQSERARRTALTILQNLLK
jgi:hypothetical protein